MSQTQTWNVAGSRTGVVHRSAAIVHGGRSLAGCLCGQSRRLHDRFHRLWLCRSPAGRTGFCGDFTRRSGKDHPWKMKALTDLRIKIFADGADLKAIAELSRNPLIKGFTTNPTLMRKAGIADYRAFAVEMLKV